MEHKTVVILVIADGDEFKNLVKSIKNTWALDKTDEVEILFYYGRTQTYDPADGQSILVNDDLYCGVNRIDICTRNSIAFNYVYHHYDFDYLFRCCSGSYIVVDKLLAFLKDKPKSSFYCGVNGGHFASGSGFFLSRDLVKMLLDSPEGFWMFPSADDVGFGSFLCPKGIRITPAPRQDFDDGVIRNLNPAVYHYHIRNQPNLMYELYRLLH